ncbi:MAG: amidohydrolase [Nitratireductor sp.]
MRPDFERWYEKNKTRLVAWRRDLHEHPEIGFEVHRTADFVAGKLREFGLEVETGIGKTGVVGILRSGKSNAAPVAFRADMDALPMQEMAEVAYKSRSKDRFHGCGHDGHTTTLLATAKFLAEDPEFEGNAVFIFQPAEEILAGARAMIADGIIEKYRPAEIYALHNIPGMEVGKAGVVRGGALASSDFVRVEVSASGTHGSAPHSGQDGVLAAATFLTTLQQSVTRVIDSRESGVISFGMIHGGTAPNILPDLVVVEGTMRTLSQEVRDRLVRQIEKVAKACEETFDVDISIDIEKAVPVTQNNLDCCDAVTAAINATLGPGRVVKDPPAIMASEDFSLFLEQIPGAYFFVGQDGAYCHHPEYVFDDNIIETGAQIFAEIARQRCKPLAHNKHHETTV